MKLAAAQLPPCPVVDHFLSEELPAPLVRSSFSPSPPRCSTARWPVSRRAAHHGPGWRRDDV